MNYYIGIFKVIFILPIVSFGQDCDCKKWERTWYDGDKIRYEYKLGCNQPNSEFKYVGMDYAACKEERKKQRIQDKFIKEIQNEINDRLRSNKAKYNSLLGYRTILRNENFEPIVGLTRNKIIGWNENSLDAKSLSNVANFTFKGEIDNNGKATGVWFFSPYENVDLKTFPIDIKNLNNSSKKYNNGIIESWSLDGETYNNTFSENNNNTLSNVKASLSDMLNDEYVLMVGNYGVVARVSQKLFLELFRINSLFFKEKSLDSRENIIKSFPYGIYISFVNGIAKDLYFFENYYDVHNEADYSFLMKKIDEEDKKRKLELEVNNRSISINKYNLALELLKYIDEFKYHTPIKTYNLNSFKTKFDKDYFIIKIDSVLNLISESLRIYTPDNTGNVNKIAELLDYATRVSDSIKKTSHLELNLKELDFIRYKKIEKKIYTKIFESIKENSQLDINVYLKIVNGKNIFKINSQSSNNQELLHLINFNLNKLSQIDTIYYYGKNINVFMDFDFKIASNSTKLKYIIIDQNKQKIRGELSDKNKMNNTSLPELKDKPLGKYDVVKIDYLINGETFDKNYVVGYKSFGGPINTLFSVFVPGLGKITSTRARKGWGDLIAVTSLGLASYYINKSANVNYEKYKTAIEQNDIDKYYNEATRQKTFALTVAVVSATIWFLDISETYSITKTNKINERNFKSKTGNFKSLITIQPTYNSFVPSLGIRYYIK